ncbi:MAG: tetratricopeptide repeat protein [Trichormus sp. ATA11-4-KO1]|jgi:tetratricopeptide (TPR) repeat protein|nr:tetratricopeptide repeat protein [Trichormus sp. ATA11-4-KO1]
MKNLKKILWILPTSAVLVGLYSSKVIADNNISPPVTQNGVTSFISCLTEPGGYYVGSWTVRHDPTSDKITYVDIVEYFQGGVYQTFSYLVNPPLTVVKNVENLVQQAMSKYEQDNYQGALSDYNQIIQLEPNNEWHYFNRGQIRRLMKDKKGAAEDFQEAIKLNPTEASAYNMLGITLQELGKIEEGVEIFTQGIRTVPELNKKERKSLYANRASAYMRLNNWQAALENLHKVIELDPSAAHYYTSRGKVRGKLGDMQGAEADLSEADRMKPDNSSLQLSIGTIYEEMGMKKKAIEHYQKATQIATKEGDTRMQQLIQEALQSAYLGL